MSAIESKARTVEQVTVDDVRVRPGPIVRPDKSSDPLRDGHKVGVILSKTAPDEDWHVDQLVDNPHENLPDAVFDDNQSLFGPLVWEDEVVEVIAVRAHLTAEFGDSPQDDTFSFADIEVLRHESLLP